MIHSFPCNNNVKHINVINLKVKTTGHFRDDLLTHNAAAAGDTCDPNLADIHAIAMNLTINPRLNITMNSA